MLFKIIVIGLFVLIGINYALHNHYSEYETVGKIFYYIFIIWLFLSLIIVVITKLQEWRMRND